MSRRTPAEFQDHPAPYVGGIYRGVVTHVTDGDTLDILLDLGCNHYDYQSVRLAAINAPERGTKEGEAATNYVKHVADGACCIIHTVKDREKFGRYLAIVYIEQGAQWPQLNQMLIDHGHAVPFMEDGIDLRELEDVKAYLATLLP